MWTRGDKSLGGVVALVGRAEVARRRTALAAVRLRVRRRRHGAAGRVARRHGAHGAEGSREHRSVGGDRRSAGRGDRRLRTGRRAAGTRRRRADWRILMARAVDDRLQGRERLLSRAVQVGDDERLRHGRDGHLSHVRPARHDVRRNVQPSRGHAAVELAVVRSRRQREAGRRRGRESSAARCSADRWRCRAATGSRSSSIRREPPSPCTRSNERVSAARRALHESAARA